MGAGGGAVRQQKALYSSLYSYSMLVPRGPRKSIRTYSDNCLLGYRDNNLKNFLLCLCPLDVNVDKPVYFKTDKKSMFSMVVGTGKIVVLSGGNFSCLATVSKLSIVWAFSKP
jgi:hypothetical protein